MTGPTQTDLNRWHRLATICVERAPIAEIRSVALRMKECVMPRSEWKNPQSVFIKLKAAAVALTAGPAAREAIERFAHQVLDILDGPGRSPSPSPSPTLGPASSQKVWQRRADIGD